MGSSKLAVVDRLARYVDSDAFGEQALVLPVDVAGEAPTRVEDAVGGQAGRVRSRGAQVGLAS